MEKDMAEFKEISPNAPAGEKLLNWVDNLSLIHI
jgi:hypothetical protein